MLPLLITLVLIAGTFTCFVKWSRHKHKKDEKLD